MSGINMKRLSIISVLLLLIIHLAGVLGSYAQDNVIPRDVAKRSPDCTDITVYSSTSENGEEDSGEYYEDYGKTLEGEQEAYHDYLNKRFETNIAAMSLVMKKTKDLSDENIQELFNDEQLATWTLARDLLCSYEKYAKYVEHVSFAYRVPEDVEGNENTIEFLKQADSQIVEWKGELEDAKKALDIALATYDHYSTVFPLHIKNRQVIRELALYREQFGHLSKLFSCLPSKFVNQSTTKCE
jgi:hypothetical protein